MILKACQLRHPSSSSTSGCHTPTGLSVRWGIRRGSLHSDPFPAFQAHARQEGCSASYLVVRRHLQRLPSASLSLQLSCAPGRHPSTELRVPTYKPFSGSIGGGSTTDSRSARCSLREMAVGHFQPQTLAAAPSLLLALQPQLPAVPWGWQSLALYPAWLLGYYALTTAVVVLAVWERSPLRELLGARDSCLSWTGHLAINSLVTAFTAGLLGSTLGWCQAGGSCMGLAQVFPAHLTPAALGLPLVLLGAATFPANVRAGMMAAAAAAGQQQQRQQGSRGVAVQAVGGAWGSGSTEGSITLASAAGLAGWLAKQRLLLGQLMSVASLAVRSLRGEWAQVVTTVLLCPLYEELIFRGFLLPTLAQLLPCWVAVAVSSAAFALQHLPFKDFERWQLELNELYPLTLLALLCAIAYMYSGSLVAPVLLHSLWNLRCWMINRLL